MARIQSLMIIATSEICESGRSELKRRRWCWKAMPTSCPPCRTSTKGLAKDNRIPCHESCTGEVTDFISELDAMINETKNCIRRAQDLLRIAVRRKELVGFSP